MIAQDRARRRFGFIEQGADAGQRHAGLAEGLDGIQAPGIGLAVAAVTRRRAPAGREPRPHTGVCICRGRRAAATVETTVVHFSPIAEDDLCAYVRTPEPYDKAGAYAIQGHAALWCAGIEGCYYNIMGLPVHRTAQLLREFT